MQLRDLPVELLCWCVRGSDGRVRRTSTALRDAFDELARLEGVDLPLVGWRCVGTSPENVSRVPVIGNLRVRPTGGRDEYDIEVTRLSCASVLDQAQVQIAVQSGAARVKVHAPRFGQFKYRSTKHTLVTDNSTSSYAQNNWYTLHDRPAICVERGGYYVRVLVRGCNATRHQGCRYFTMAHACDGLWGSGEDDTLLREAFRNLGPRILAAKRFCDRLVEKQTCEHAHP